MTTERALKHALVPLASAALVHDIDLICEVLTNVGEYVLGERRHFTELVARAAGQATEARGGAASGEVCVRLARQQAGFEPTDRVLVSVSLRRATDAEDFDPVEATLPLAERHHDEQGTRVLAGVRVLAVIPAPHPACVQSTALRRFGATVESVPDVDRARVRLRDSVWTGLPIDILYLDDRARHVAELLDEMRGDASLGQARGIVGTALRPGPQRDAYRAAGALTLSKPVLPFELRDAIVKLAMGTMCDSDRPPCSVVGAPVSSVVVPRRSPAMRSAHLAEVLASLAIGTDTRHR